MRIDEIKKRTAEKLAYARVHLEEFATMPPGRGHAFERAHHEAFLAQLFGAYDSLLNELNTYLRCGLKPMEQNVKLGELHRALCKQGRKSHVLTRLYELGNDKNSWFCQAKGLRDTSMHVTGMPLSYYHGGDETGKVALVDPRTKSELQFDVEKTFGVWLSEMEKLVEELRSAAIKEGV